VVSSSQILAKGVSVTMVVGMRETNSAGSDTRQSKDKTKEK